MPLLSVERFVRIEMTAVALGLGSNKQFSGLRPEEILGGAIFELSKILRGIAFSSIYRTKAMYVVDQDAFFNMALVGFLDDGIRARDLLEQIHKIEAMFGRDREKEIRFGPRSLDIDIECFGRQRILEPDLQIPHPRLMERAFVLVPLLEVLDELENRKTAAGNNSAFETARSSDSATARTVEAHVLEKNAEMDSAQEIAIQNNAVCATTPPRSFGAHVSQIVQATRRIRSDNAATQTMEVLIFEKNAEMDSAQETAAGNNSAQEIVIQNNSVRVTAPARSSSAPVSQAAEAAREIISANATARSVDAQAAEAASEIISTNATAHCADTINGEIFCLRRDEISDALFSLGETDGGVEKIIRAQDFLPFIKSRLQDGTGSK